MQTFINFLKTSLCAVMVMTGQQAVAIGNNGPAVVLLVDADSYNDDPDDQDSWLTLRCRGGGRNGCVMQRYSERNNKSGYEFTVHGWKSTNNGIFLNGILDHSQIFLSRSVRGAGSPLLRNFINCPTLPSVTSNSSLCMVESCRINRETRTPNPDCGVKAYHLMTNQTYHEADFFPFLCTDSNGGDLDRCDPEDDCPCCNNNPQSGSPVSRCYDPIFYKNTPFVIRNIHLKYKPQHGHIPKVLNCKWARNGEGVGRTCRMVSDRDCITQEQVDNGQCEPQFFIAVDLRPYPKPGCD